MQGASRRGFSTTQKPKKGKALLGAGLSNNASIWDFIDRKS